MSASPTLTHDVGTNTGPSVEEQITSLHDAINKKFDDLTPEVSRAVATLKLVETSISDLRDSVYQLKGQVEELEYPQHVIHLDIDVNSVAMDSPPGGGLTGTAGALQPQRE